MTDAERPPQERYWTPKYWPYWILLGVLRLICLLPHRMRLSVGFFIGRLGHRFVASRRAITRRNIELCFPDLDEEQRNAMLAQVPLGRLGEGDDIANSVLFLASGAGAYITGETLHVNGGMVMD